LSLATTYQTRVSEQAITLLHETTGMWSKPVFRLKDMAGNYRCIADTRWQITNDWYLGIDRFWPVSAGCHLLQYAVLSLHGYCHAGQIRCKRVVSAVAIP